MSLIVYSGKHYGRQRYPWNFARTNQEFYNKVGNLRAIGGTTATKEALEDALVMMETRNKSIPTLIMVVTDGRSQDDPTVPARKLQSIPDTYVFAAATGSPELVDK